jgi:tryptophan-rich sensory protein
VVAISGNVRALAAFALLTLGAAVVGGLASARATDYYESLSRPSWAPPGWLFGVVWTPLYVLIAIAPWLVWRERGEHAVGAALAVWAAQLVLNALWTWIFFAWERPGAALVEIVALLVLIAVTIVLFARVSPLAAALLVPYFLWVAFATALNASLWRAAS